MCMSRVGYPISMDKKFKHYCLEKNWTLSRAKPFMNISSRLRALRGTGNKLRVLREYVVIHLNCLATVGIVEYVIKSVEMPTKAQDATKNLAKTTCFHLSCPINSAC